jgi:imidazolonepropionase-like amidohydrolase
MKKYILSIAICTLFFVVKAQNTTTILTNATIHIGNGETIEKGVLVFEKGKIIHVGKELSALYKNAKVVDASGKHVYPGIIACNSIMGLNEIDAVRATRDYNETGDLNPNIRSLIAYNTDSKILPTATFNGILYAQAVPQGGTISGTSCLVKTQAWNWEDAAVIQEDGIHLHWPSLLTSSSNHENAEKQLLKSKEKINEIESFFLSAYQYSQTTNPAFNARLHAMKGLFTGQLNLYIHTSEAKGIISSINFFQQKFPAIKLVLVGASEAYQVIDFLKNKNIPIILSSLHNLPLTKASDIDQPYKTPAQLNAAGIKVVLSKEGSWECRNLPFIAGTAAANGLNKEEALKTITLNAAQVLGISQRLGSLEVGKDASLLIAEGDLLDMRTNVLIAAFIEGEPVDLNNEQQQLATKFKKKYGIN